MKPQRLQAQICIAVRWPSIRNVQPDAAELQHRIRDGVPWMVDPGMQHFLAVPPPNIDGNQRRSKRQNFPQCERHLTMVRLPGSVANDRVGRFVAHHGHHEAAGDHDDVGRGESAGCGGVVDLWQNLA